MVDLQVQLDTLLTETGKTTNEERQRRVEVAELDGEYAFLKMQVDSLEKELQREKTEHANLRERARLEDEKVETLMQVTTKNRYASSLFAIEKDMLADQVRQLHERSRLMQDQKYIQDRTAYENYLHVGQNDRVSAYRDTIFLVFHRVLRDTLE